VKPESECVPKYSEGEVVLAEAETGPGDGWSGQLSMSSQRNGGGGELVTGERGRS
jgi:hypothetical protein